MSRFNRHTATPRSTPRAFARAGAVLLVVSTVTYYWVKGRIDDHRLEFTRPENRNSTRILTWEERAELDAQDTRRELEQLRKKSAILAALPPPPASSAPPPPPAPPAV